LESPPHGLARPETGGIGNCASAARV
jgi:hypothetical protein